jgi:hypothetical protein
MCDWLEQWKLAADLYKRDRVTHFDCLHSETVEGSKEKYRMKQEGSVKE